MNTSILSFVRNLTTLRGKDVFSDTQGRLARIYSGLLILFLLLFIVIVYVVLYVTILKNQERELQSLAAQETRYFENFLLDNDKRDLSGVQSQEIVFAGVNQAFYYVIYSNGEIILGNEADRRLRPALTTLLNIRMIKDNQILNETLHVEGNPNGRGKQGRFLHSEPVQDIRLMIASQPIYYKGQFIGQLYIGKDISFAYQLFKLVLVILAVLGLVFFVVAVFISQKMSKRAMIPISGAFRRQREFVADASHELRTPLSVLLSSIDAMEMTIEPKKEDFAARMLTNMRQEVKRMTHLVSELLTLARSDSNTIHLRVETFDFRPLADKALESVSPLADEKQITTSLDAPTSLMAIGDPERLSQLLYILLDNAIKYTPNGGKVKVFLSKEGPDLCMAVQDTGIGIKKEDFTRIFERFYRLDKSRSRQIGGHGLGLSIAKWIVETHKGTIKVASEPGKGSTFFIRVPDAKG
ncbi:sensor histidine kinase [Neobacillus sp. NPDC097160]|uniref:sensor histidine kinase n=1 Tax=Neobacillus sp. NPDC097160 TaxID=3364298 RepID=UPI00381D23B3